MTNRPPTKDEITPFVKEGRPDKRGVYPKQKLDVSRFKDLRDVQIDYALFSVAAPYVYGAFDDRRWAEIPAITGREFPLHYVRLDRPVFGGLELPGRNDASWNYALFAVKVEDYPAASEFLLKMMTIDSVNNLAYAYAEQEVLIEDVLAVRNRSVIDTLPVVKVCAWAVRGSRATWAFYGNAPPVLTRMRPSRRVADAVAGYQKETNPLVASAAGELERRKQGPPAVTPQMIAAARRQANDRLAAEIKKYRPRPK